MNTTMRILAAGLVAMTLISASVAHAADATWVPGGGPNDWNVDANWLNIDNQNFTPDAGFEDEPVIANGGTAFLDAEAVGNDDPFPSVTISNGGLEIRDGGGLKTNLLDVGESGSLSLAGNGSLSVSGDASTIGNTRIEGPNVDYSVTGAFTVGGSFQPVVTGAQHSAVNVGGAANVSGTLRPEFNGVTPKLGDSWPLVDAASVAGTFETVDTSLLPPLESGVIYTAAVNSGEGDINLVVTNTLDLLVNRRTGQATMRNIVGDPISIDGYTISSPSSLLNPADGAWLSLADSGNLGDGWTEGTSTADAISESKAGDPGSIAVGSPVSLGAPVVPTNFAPEDLRFSVAADGVTLPGLVSYEGVPFNLVLNVDPDNGSAEITNQATIPIEFDGYAIQSASGALQSADGSWSSLEDSGAGGEGWREANPSANALAELNPTSTTTLGPNQSLALGTVFDTANEADLTFTFFLAGGTPDLRAGFVAYGLDTETNPLDCNGDGLVDLLDLDCANAAGITSDLLDTLKLLPGDIDGGGVGFSDFLILSTNFNSDLTKYTEGNIDGVNGVGFSDFLILSTNFNMSVQGAAGVPEPTSLGLLGLGVLLLGAIRRRRQIT